MAEKNDTSNDASKVTSIRQEKRASHELKKDQERVGTGHVKVKYRRSTIDPEKLALISQAAESRSEEEDSGADDSPPAIPRADQQPFTKDYTAQGPAGDFYDAPKKSSSESPTTDMPMTDEIAQDEEQLEAARQLRREKLQKSGSGKQSDQGYSEETTTKQKVSPGTIGRPMGLITFLILFFLAVVKDISDFFDLGIAGMFINLIPILAILLIILLSGQGVINFFRKRRYIIISGAAIEFIPLIGIVPVWTLSMIWIWWESRKQRQVSLQAITRMAKKQTSKSGIAKRLARIRK